MEHRRGRGMTASRAPKILTRYGPTPNITSARPGRAPGAARRNPAIELRDGSGFSVHLSYGTRARIEDEIGDARRRFGEFVETGGWLYAQRPPVVDAYICRASGPGRESRHEPTSTRISSPRTVEAEFSDDLVRAELCRVGCWHAHGWPDPQPSDTDLRTWAKARSDFGLDRFVGLIATPGEVGWLAAHFHAWVTYRADGRTVCEPAILDE